MLGLLTLNMLLVFRTVVHYPEQVMNSHWFSQEPLESRTIQETNPLANSVDNFASRCRQEMPPDARILFHGAQEAWIFAYEVYPRRVFMLPSDGFQLTATLLGSPSALATPAWRAK